MLTFPTLESADILTVQEARVTANPFNFDVPLLQSFFAPTAWEEDNEVKYWVSEFLAGSVCSAAFPLEKGKTKQLNRWVQDLGPELTTRAGR